MLLEKRESISLTLKGYVPPGETWAFHGLHCKVKTSPWKKEKRKRKNWLSHLFPYSVPSKLLLLTTPLTFCATPSNGWSSVLNLLIIIIWFRGYLFFKIFLKLVSSITSTQSSSYVKDALYSTPCACSSTSPCTHVENYI